MLTYFYITNMYVDTKSFPPHCDVGVRCEDSAAASPESDPRSAWDGKDCDLCDHSLSPGATRQRVWHTSVCTLYYSVLDLHINSDIFDV